MADLGLAGRKVLVTGASRGIGAALARAFARAGCHVTLLAESEEVHEAAADVGRAVVCDVCDAHAVGRLDVGPLDILVNNAGVERETRLDDPDAEATFVQLMDVNVTGMFRVTQRLLPALRTGGAIINTASVWGRCAPAGFSAYAASKHAVIGLTRAWSRELAGRRIRVNAVCPGWVGTPAALASLGAMADRQGVPPEIVRAQIEAAQDIPGLMSPADVASLYLFLASDLAANITGQAINVDRGELQA